MPDGRARRGHPAMVLAVAGLVAQGRTVIEGAEVVGISYPEFWDDLERLAEG